EEAVQILKGLRSKYETHHKAKLTDEALVAAVELSDRYITGRFLPDKAIDLIDQAGARVRLRTGTRGADLRNLERRADELQRDKDQAVASEQYERASQLRDEISEIRQQIDRMERSTRPAAEQAEVPGAGAADIAQVVSRATGIP